MGSERSSVHQEKRDTGALDAQQESDRHWMAMALTEASKGVGQTRPNPPVGAVVVRDGRCLGKGYHQRAGGAHAEVEALQACSVDPAGATLYVTLEPCSTQGRTPPCTNLILERRLARVVVASDDPNPNHRGRGLRLLTRAGVRVDTGVCRDEGDRLIAPFGKWITTRRPFVTLKLATTLDGCLADRQRNSQWITGAEARAEVQRLRRAADVVMVGSGTARADNPSLRYRGPAPDIGMRLVVDSRGSLSPDAKLFTDGESDRTIVATTSACPETRRLAYEAAGAAVWVLPSTKGQVSLPSLMLRLGRNGVLHVLCEGGAGLAGGLVDAALVDAYVMFLAPKLLGGGDALACIGGKGRLLPRALNLTFESVQPVGCDMMICAKPRVNP